MNDAPYLTISKLNELSDQNLRIIKKILTYLRAMVSGALTSDQINETTKLFWQQRLLDLESKPLNKGFFG
jgi:hypothetical protein